MSENRIINAIIALIEDRTDEAKEMLRSPEMRVSSSDIQGRLGAAIDFRESKATTFAMKTVLYKSLRADPKDEARRNNLKWNSSHEEAYFLGISHVESIIEACIEELNA